MKRLASPETVIASSYRTTFASTASASVLTDLVGFAQEAKDPAVRAGRMDVIARILRQRGKGIPDTAPDIYDNPQVEAE